MVQARNVIAGLRPELDLAHRWGLYSVDDDRWLAVVFTTMKEAEEATRVLTSPPKPRARRG